MLAWVAVGIGINVRGPAPAGLAEPVAAVADAVPGAQPLKILEHLVPALLAAEGANAFLEDAERARFMRLAWPRAGDVIAGLDADGALLLRKPDGSFERRTEAS